jgi:hypothetical protein
MRMVRPDSDAVSRDQVQVDVCLYIMVSKWYLHKWLAKRRSPKFTRYLLWPDKAGDMYHALYHAAAKCHAVWKNKAAANN